MLWVVGMLGTSLTTQEAWPCELDIQARSITFVLLRADFPGNLLKMTTVRLQKPWLEFDTGSYHLPSCHYPTELFLLYKVASTPSSTFPLQSSSCLTIHTPLIQDTFELRRTIVIEVQGGTFLHTPTQVEKGKDEDCWSQTAQVDSPAPAFPGWVIISLTSLCLSFLVK